MIEEIPEESDFFPMICEDCGKSFGKDVIKLAVHSSTHYPDRATNQPPTRYSHSKKQKDDPLVLAS